MNLEEAKIGPLQIEAGRYARRSSVNLGLRRSSMKILLGLYAPKKLAPLDALGPSN